MNMNQNRQLPLLETGSPTQLRIFYNKTTPVSAQHIIDVIESKAAELWACDSCTWSWMALWFARNTNLLRKKSNESNVFLFAIQHNRVEIHMIAKEAKTMFGFWLLRERRKKWNFIWHWNWFIFCLRCCIGNCFELLIRWRDLRGAHGEWTQIVIYGKLLWRQFRIGNKTVHRMEPINWM